MKVSFSITNNDGSPILDKVTGQPHAFTFDKVSEDVLNVFYAWNERMGNKYPNAGEFVREIIYRHGFLPIVPPEILAAFDAPVKQAEKDKEAFLQGFFGVTPTE